MNHFGGADGLGDETLGVRFPRHYINLFPLEFVDNALNAVAAQPDAGPHRVNALLSGVDGYLAAKAGVPGNGFDFHGAVINFRHFNLKEPFQHIPVAAGNQDFRAFVALPHIQHIDLDALPLLVALRRHLLLGGHQGLGPAQVQVHRAVGFRLFHHAGDDVAPMLEKFLVEEFPFRFPQALQDYLFSGLGGDAAGDIGNSPLRSHLVPDVGVFFDPAGRLEGNLPAGVFDLGDDGFQGVNAHFPGVGVEGYADVLAGRRVVLAESRGQGHLNGAQYLLPGQMPFRSHLGQRYQKIAFHCLALPGLKLTAAPAGGRPGIPVLTTPAARRRFNRQSTGRQAGHKTRFRRNASRQYNIARRLFQGYNS